MVQNGWDKFEVALLIEAYQNVKQGRIDKNSALLDLSQKLRLMAQYEGIKIDNTYRNYNGMIWQFGYIERAFLGERYDSRSPSRIFAEMVDIYNHDRNQFDTILKEAHEKIELNTQLTDDDYKSLFIAWLEKNSKVSTKQIVENIEYISAYVNKRSVHKKSLWEYRDYKEINIVRVRISGDRLFRLLHGKEHRQFEKNGKLFSDFLRSRQEAIPATNETENLSNELTKIESVIEDEPKSKSEKCQTSNTLPNGEFEYDFYKTQKLAYTKPVYVSYKDQIADQVKSWRDVYIFLCRAIFKEKGNESLLCGKSLVGPNRPDFGNYKMSSQMVNPIKITDDCYVEANLSATDIMKRITLLHEWEHISFSNTIVRYVIKDKKDKPQPNKIRAVIPLIKKAEKQKASEELKLLLLKKFPYGIKTTSIIDIMKLKNYAEELGVRLPSDEQELKTMIDNEGYVYEGKTYFVSDETYAGIIELIESIFDSGLRVVYYEKLFSSHEEWFEDNYILSWEFIRCILNSRSNDMFVGRNFVRKGNESINEREAVEFEIESVWGDSVTHTYEELYKLLPYIPEEKIKFNLSACKNFVWSTVETFALLSKIVISDEDRQDILEFVSNECELNGHVSIANLPLDNVIEENYHVSINAIYDAVDRLVFKDKFVVSGKIITKSDYEIDAFTLAKTYCSSKDACTLTELNEYIETINGVPNRPLALNVAYDQLVRVDCENFVADRLVNFNVDAIDEILEGIIVGNFFSVKSVATFVMFPNCGYSWNYYILESFCYRFSKKFRLELLNFNDKNAGIIAKKLVNLSYADMLVEVAVRSGLDLTVDSIGQYLFENGYTTRGKMSTIDYVVENAKKKRERM